MNVTQYLDIQHRHQLKKRRERFEKKLMNFHIRKHVCSVKTLKVFMHTKL